MDMITAGRTNMKGQNNPVLTAVLVAVCKLSLHFSGRHFSGRHFSGRQLVWFVRKKV